MGRGQTDGTFSQAVEGWKTKQLKTPSFTTSHFENNAANVASLLPPLLSSLLTWSLSSRNTRSSKTGCRPHSTGWDQQGARLTCASLSSLIELKKNRCYKVESKHVNDVNRDSDFLPGSTTVTLPGSAAGEDTFHRHHQHVESTAC